MRIASAIIGLVGAGLGVVKGLIFVLGALAIGTMGGLGLFDSFVLLSLGTDGAVVVSCVLGAVGAGLVLGNESAPVRC